MKTDIDLAQAEIDDDGFIQDDGFTEFSDFTPSSVRPDGWPGYPLKYFDTGLGYYRQTLSNRLDTGGFHRGTLQLHNVQEVQEFGSGDTTDWTGFPARGWPYFDMDSSNTGELHWAPLDDDNPRTGQGRYRSLELTGGGKLQVTNFTGGLVNSRIDTDEARIPIRDINHITGSDDSGKTSIFWPLLKDIVRDVKVAVDSSATADYIGALPSDGVIRCDTRGIGYRDEGDFVFLKHINNCDTLSNTDSATLFYGLSIDSMGHIKNMDKRDAGSGLLPPGNNRYEVLSWLADGVNFTWQPDWVRAHA
jgi:hypothetical protein